LNRLLSLLAIFQIFINVAGDSLVAQSLRAEKTRAQLVNSRDINDYLPLRVGNKWVYSVERAGLGSVSRWEVAVEPDANEPVRMSPYYRLTGYFTSKTTSLVYSNRNQDVFERGNDRRDYLWYQFGAPVGYSWEMRFPPEHSESCQDGARLSIGARDEVVTTPAGEFRDVIRIDYQTLCQDAGIVSEWFAPGVGLIRREETSFAGPVISELVYAELGKTTLPRGAYSTSLYLSSPRYGYNLMPPVDPSRLPRVRGAFVVRNRTGEPFELVFPDSCQGLRLEVRNSEGEVVLEKNTLENVACLPVVTHVDLSRRPLVVPFSFVLSDKEGKPLPDGLYTLTAELLNLPNPPVARSVFEVESVH